MNVLRRYSKYIQPAELVIILICIVLTACCVYNINQSEPPHRMLVNIGIDIALIVAAAVYCIAIYFNGVDDGLSDRLMLLFFLAALTISADAFSLSANYNPDHILLNSFAHFIKNMLFVICTQLFVFYQMGSLVVTDGFRRTVRIVTLSLSTIALFLLVLNIWCGELYRITEDGRVVLEDGMHLFMLCPVISGTVTVVTAIHYCSEFREKATNLLIILSSWALMIVDWAIPEYSLIYICPMLVLLFIFSNFYAVRSQKYAENQAALAQMEKDLAEERFSNMVSQIQPHFLYNSLTSIMNIKGNPPETRDAIADFGAYLRSNLNTLNARAPIPFSKELDHVENYLELEKLRFKDNLEIVWHITDRRFVIPSLSVQMMVENAVRHGITQRENGGRLTIVSEQVEDGHLVKIIDTGVGFDEKNVKNDGRAHIGIRNTRRRIESMVGGTLTIKSTPGIGTTVTIFIPDDAGHQASGTD